MRTPAWLKRLVESQPKGAVGESASRSPSATASSATPSVPGINPAADSKQLAEGMTAIRENLNRYAVALGAIATAVFAGVSLSVVDVLFPPPRTVQLIWIPAIICALLGVGGLVALTGRLFRAQSRIVFSPSIVGQETYKKLSPRPPSSSLRRREGAVVEQVLREHALEENATSALSLELRALRLARVARRLERMGDQGVAAAVARIESERLNNVLGIAVMRASLSVLEMRAQKTFGARALAELALTVTGVIGLVFLSQYSQGERELIALGQSCAVAEAAGVADACDKVDLDYVEPTAPPGPSTQDLVEAARTCTRQIDSEFAENPTVPTATRDEVIAACIDEATADDE